MLILATSSKTSHSCFPLFNIDHLEIGNCSNLTIVFHPLGNFGQALCIRSFHEDLILTRKSDNCPGIAFIQGDSAGGSKLIEQTLHKSQTSIGPPSLAKSSVDATVFFRTTNEDGYRRNGTLLSGGNAEYEL